MLVLYIVCLVTCLALVTLFGVVQRRKAINYSNRRRLKEDLGFMYFISFIPFVNVFGASVGMVILFFWVLFSLIGAVINKIVGE